MKRLDAWLKKQGACAPVRRRYRKARTLREAYDLAVTSNMHPHQHMFWFLRKLDVKSRPRCTCNSSTPCYIQWDQHTWREKFPYDALKDTIRKKVR